MLTGVLVGGYPAFALSSFTIFKKRCSFFGSALEKSILFILVAIASFTSFVRGADGDFSLGESFCLVRNASESSSKSSN